jgi:hypothetical protein
LGEDVVAYVACCLFLIVGLVCGCKEYVANV